VTDPDDNSPGCVVFFFAGPGDGPLMGSDAHAAPGPGLYTIVSELGD